MNAERRLVEFIAHLGGPRALFEYVNAHRQEGPPPEKVELLMDFRPVGGVIVGGYEDNQWWDLDTGEAFRFRPDAWARFPEGA